MKNFKLLLSVTLLLLSKNIIGQSKFSEIEKLLDIVVYIYDEKTHTEKVDGKQYEVWYKVDDNAFIPKTFAHTGSGFFIQTDVDFYLVTASHVANNTTMNTNIVVRNKNGIPKIFKLPNIIENADSLDWINHAHADVASILLNRMEIPDEIFAICIPFDVIEYELRAPFREREVTVFGYPLSLGIGRKISPITKTSKPSSELIDMPRFDTKQTSIFYLLDDPSVSGFSGGPVFELPQLIGTGTDAIFVRTQEILGLIHGTISDKISGFTAVVPSIFIKEAIELAPGFSDTLTFKYNNGVLWSQRIYENGNPWTVLSNFNQKCETQEMGTLKNGSGSLYLYDEKGKLLQIRKYKNGSLINIKQVKE